MGLTDAVYGPQEAGVRCSADAVPADRVQELSNALEFYPSRAEAREMAEEARGKGDGNAPSEVTLERYLEVLEQHRPAESLDESQLERAFQVRKSLCFLLSPSCLMWLWFCLFKGRRTVKWTSKMFRRLGNSSSRSM